MASPAFERPQALDYAVAAYRAGRYLEAEQICQQIVSTRSECFDALYVLAVVQATHAPALENYNRGLVLQPHHAEALSNRGNTLKALKRLEEALDSYDRAIALQPDYVLAPQIAAPFYSTSNDMARLLRVTIAHSPYVRIM
ncbi:MAG: tetratricopeptide repeat protein [Pseudolabrys sp.]